MPEYDPAEGSVGYLTWNQWDRLSINLGDRVTVPYGRKRLEGTVVDTLRLSSGRKIVVSVPIGDDGEMISAYDEDTLARPA